jgi:hypothetical protein
MASTKRLYRIQFLNQGKTYELYARSVIQGALFGFIEIEDLVFGEKSAVLVDPAEEGLKKEFENTKRIFIPMHSVLRIDELEKTASFRPRIIPMDQQDGGQNTRPAPVLYSPPG